MKADGQQRPGPALGGGDELRFRRFFADHYRPLLAYALRRSAESDAHDVTAETFMVAWRRFADVPRDRERERAWLYAIATRVLANQRRSQRRALRLLERLRGQPPDAVIGVDAVGQIRESYREVIASLVRLSEGDREVLRLAAWEHLSAQEIADVLGCSANAASIRLHRARRRLAAELRKEHAAAGHEEAHTSRGGLRP